MHGNHTWSYLWCNIIPTVPEMHRAIAFDLMGFGRSEHPLDSRYDFDAAILDGFIEQLGPERLSLVLYDWGGLLGLQYVVAHPSRITKVVLASTYVLPLGARGHSPRRTHSPGRYHARTIGERNHPWRRTASSC